MPVIARSLALIALKASELENKSISDRAAFLNILGLSKEEIAPLLGSSPASITELLRQRAKKGDANGKLQKGSKKSSK
jgi:transposase